MTLKISRGVIKRPYFILEYGPDGCGKSTFAGDAPSPIFLGPERGSSHLNVARFDDVKTWEDIVLSVKALIKDSQGFKTLALDSLDWMEPLLWEHVCKLDNATSIDEAFGGYGKGYNYALSVWSDFLKNLEELRDTGMNIIAIAHAQVKTFNDPNHPLPYDRYSLKLNEKAAAKWREAVEAVLFMNFEDNVYKVNKTDKKAKATSSNIRKIYTERTAAYDAKNRLGLPPELPLSWDAFDKAAQLGQPDSTENIMKDIQELTAVLAPDVVEKMKSAVAKANGDATQLTKIRNYARTLGE